MHSSVKLTERILLYCKDIEETMTESGANIDDFMNNWKYQHNCVFCIEQIGESVKKIEEQSPDLTKKYPNIYWKWIVGMRDIIADDHLGINLRKIWIFIEEELPEMKKACEELLRELKKTNS